jgi:hypothetical protein
MRSFAAVAKPDAKLEAADFFQTRDLNQHRDPLSFRGKFSTTVTVMAGLVPAIHDARHKAGHDK